MDGAMEITVLREALQRLARDIEDLRESERRLIAANLELQATIDGWRARAARRELEQMQRESQVAR